MQRSSVTASRQPRSPEAARLLAIILLVAYHVIGADSVGGLKVSDSHPLRLFANFFADLRMPLFAAVAGYVYALRPVAPAQLLPFLKGKFRRLALPGAVAITIFMLVAFATGTRFSPSGDWLLNYVTPYVHFWFLQAILVIFVLVCSLDILLRGRFLWLIALLAVALSLSKATLPTNIMSINHAAYLLPYFLAGTLASRNYEALRDHRVLVIAVAATLVLVATWVNLQHFNQTGTLGTDLRDLQSLAFGLGGAVLCLLLLPDIRSRNLGAFGFTIYLYHVLATSGMRRVLDGWGVENLWVHLILGMVAGIFLPILLHLLVAGHSLTAWLFLGQSRQWSRHKVSQNTI